MAELAYSQEHEQSWPAQGGWTYQDYLRLPDDGQRYEIIRGNLYVTAAPTFDHQFVAARFSRLLGNFVEEHDLGLVLFAPFDVNLPALTSPVQPDILFMRAGNQPQPGDKNFEGVPDLVVEIISPGTSQVDKQVKYSAYQEAGVREYWLVEPITCKVVIHAQAEGARGFTKVGRFGRGQRAQSVLLPGFAVEVDRLFLKPRVDVSALGRSFVSREDAMLLRETGARREHAARRWPRPRPFSVTNQTQQSDSLGSPGRGQIGNSAEGRGGRSAKIGRGGSHAGGAGPVLGTRSRVPWIAKARRSDRGRCDPSAAYKLEE